jgi:hypothetical protein
MISALGIQCVKEGYWYGLQARPLSLGAQPANQINCIDEKEAAKIWPFLAGQPVIRHGAIEYAEPLSNKEVSDFELKADLSTLNSMLDFNSSTYVDLENDNAKELQEVLSDHLGLGGDFPIAVVNDIMAKPNDTINQAIKRHSLTFRHRNKTDVTRKAWEQFKAFCCDVVASPEKIRTLLAELVV